MPILTTEEYNALASALGARELKGNPAAEEAAARLSAIISNRK